MHLTIERSAFIKALAHVQSVVERRTTIPILTNLMLKAEDGALSLSATDLELEIIEKVPAEIGTAGSATAPAHMLYDIVRKLPEGSQIDLNASGDPARLKISTGRSNFSLGCLPVEDFPTLSSGGLPHRFVLDAGALSSLIDRTRFAMSTEETRYYLNGIYLHAYEGDEGGL
ncbi:MAG: DNA polymerase III subunit beta, partial [Pseudomonadota bacterium]